MASRMKERGGSGGKVMALHPSQRSALEGTPMGKVAARRAPSVGKENPGRTPVAGKESARAVSRGKVAPGVAQRPADSQVVEKVPVVPAGVRWSTSSMPRGKSSTPSDFARLMADFRARGGVQGRHPANGPVIEVREKIVAKETRNAEPSVKGSPTICKTAGRFPQPRKAVASRDASNGMEMSAFTNILRLSDSVKSSGIVGSHLRRSVSRPRGCNSEKVGEKTFDRHVDSSSMKEFADQNYKKDFSKPKECLKVRDSSNGKVRVGSCSELTKRNSERTVVTDVSKQDKLLGSESRPAAERTAVLESCGKSGPAAFHFSKSHEMPSKVLHSLNIFQEDEDISAKGVCKESSEKKSTMKASVETLSKGIPANVAVSQGEKVSKHSSKLHEKLAYLEGKVQRIASDIKRTKDILESNSPSASTLLLSDIQSKISGIEEAVSHVIGGVDTEPAAPVDKSFNPKELEARFFPHHKLLRTRTSSVGSKGNINGGTIEVCSVDENPIALEFLASLDGDSAAIRHAGSENAASSEGRSALNDAGIDSREKYFASMLTTEEKIEEFDDQENKPVIIPKEETEDSLSDQLFEIGSKSSTGGWFVSEGEAVLLAHGDGSCSYFDVANDEGKAEYKPSVDISSNLWGDCWLIRAPGADGCAGRYVVAASAGNTLGSGFCSWDFYTRKVSALRIEEGCPSSLSSASSPSRAVLAPLQNSGLHRGSSFSSTNQWWYRPCGPLLVSASSGQSVVNAFDIRDGEMVMTWNLQNPVTAMEYSSPLQWRSRGKVVLAEEDTVRLWDVNSLSPQPLLSVSSGQRINALHVNNTDAELGGGVRQRMSSSDVEGNDGAFSTDEEVNVVDLRLPSGVGLKIPKKPSCAGESIFSRGDAIYLGCTESTSSGGGKSAPRSIIRHFSLRKGKMAASYQLPKVNAHVNHAALTQVWGSSNLVMGVCGMGLFVFDADGSNGENGGGVDSHEVFGLDDLYYPSFDYLGSRVLLISRDRPAMWRYLY